MITSMKSSTVASRALSATLFSRSVNVLLTVLVSDENLTIQHLVVFQNVVEHLLVQGFRRCLKGYLHSASFFLLQVNVPVIFQYPALVQPRESDQRRFLVQPDANSVKFRFEQSSLFRPLRSIKDHENHVTCLLLLASVRPT